MGWNVDAEEKVKSDSELEKLRKENQALQAWSDVAVESNRDVSACLKKRFPHWGSNFDEGMPVDNIRQVVEYLDECLRVSTFLDESLRVSTTPKWGSGRPPMTSGLRAEKALRNILEVTNPDAPGIYEAITVEKINNLARNAMRIPDAPLECWSHHRPVPDDAPKRKHVNRTALAREALDKLSGTLSHDNVAAAKQILKKILD